LLLFFYVNELNVLTDCACNRIFHMVL